MKHSVVIIGPGRIGRDLLIKVLKQPSLSLLALVGRDRNSTSAEFASEHNVNFVSGGLGNALLTLPPAQTYIDCTSAQSHSEHVKLLSPLSSNIIDLTPSGLGVTYAPYVTPVQSVLGSDVSLVSCGGQTTIPMLHGIKNLFESIQYIEITSSMSSLSLGPATRLNLDEYICTTENAIMSLVAPSQCKVMINVNPATPPVRMKTSVSITGNLTTSLNELADLARVVAKEIQKYCPGYNLKIPPTVINSDRIYFLLEVTGAGDYLPSYAGNLDIINSACIHLCNEFANFND